MKNDASLILMAYPDVFVRPSTEYICKILPYLGVGTKDAIKAGHAALCLVNHTTGDIDYFDFGRYITPQGKGRVRSKKTDTELHVPLRAHIEKGVITNIEEILQWLYNHPEKTHGDGKLVATVSQNINSQKARQYIENLHNKGSVEYGVFVKNGSNCARFVAETLLHGTTNKKIRRGIEKTLTITPSPLGIIRKGTSSGKIYIIDENGIQITEKISRRKNLFTFLHRKKHTTEKEIVRVKNTQLLRGTGSSAQFNIEKESGNTYIITRYNERGQRDCSGLFTPKEEGFDMSNDFHFIYDSNCHHAHIQQSGKVYTFIKKQS